LVAVIVAQCLVWFRNDPPLVSLDTLDEHVSA